MSQHRIGLTAGLLSYVIWGLFPLFWPLLDRTGEVEILRTGSCGRSRSWRSSSR